MSLEIWRDIPETSGKYQVSTWGRVRNASGKILKTYENHNGYEKVELYIDGRGYKRRVNRLVAEAFVPNPEELPQVNHRDGNRHNNSVTNLEWVTNLQNAQKAKLLRTLREGKDIQKYL